MNRRLLWGIALVLALAVLEASAFAQAAAEAALLGASTATGTVKAGSALGSALNQATKQLAGRVQQETSHPALGKMSQPGRRPVSTSPVKSTVVPSSATPPQGSMIVSIQGAGNRPSPARPAAAMPGNKAEAGQTNGNGQDSSAQPARKNR
jgi:hypothetical protein